MTQIQMLISNVYKYCFSGYGQFIVFKTKIEAKSYLKNNPSIYRIKDLLTITDELRQKISATRLTEVFEVIDNVAVPMEIEMTDNEATKRTDASEKIWWSHEKQDWISIDEAIENTRSDEEIADDLWNDSNPENCDGCANQESIAAPGETTKCREHQENSDDEHYAEMRKFFTENLKDLEFNSYLPYCSQCGKKDPDYVGMMRTFQRDFPFTFVFCIDCRDELVRRADAAKQSPERFGV